MEKMMNLIVSEESGQGMVEYALILALISIAAIAAMRLVGGSIITRLTGVSTTLDGTTTSP